MTDLSIAALLALDAYDGVMACCRFRGHRVKVFLLKPESMNAKTNIQPRV